MEKHAADVLLSPQYVLEIGMFRRLLCEMQKQMNNKQQTEPTEC